MNQLQINSNIEQLHSLVQQIKDLDHLISNIKDEELCNSYAEELLQVLDKYKDLCKELKKELEDLFVFEKQNGLTTDLNLYKLFKVLENNT